MFNRFKYLFPLLFLLLSVSAKAQTGTQNFATGTITTTGSTCSPTTNCVVFNYGATKNLGGVSITVSGTFSGTLTFEASGDSQGAVLAALGMTPLAGGSQTTTTTGTGVWTTNVSGLNAVRVRASALASGSAVISIQGSTAAAQVPGSGGGGGSGTVTSVTFTGDGVVDSSTPSSAVTSAGTVTATVATGTGNVFIASPLNGTSGNLSQRTIGEADLPAATVFTDQNATFGAHSYSFTAATIAKLRVSAGLTTSANGDIGYDTTNKNWHAWQNGADSYLFSGLVSGTYNNGDCTQFTVAASVVTLTDTGSACNGTGANLALSNLSAVSINTSLAAQTGVDAGTSTHPFRNVFLWGTGTYGTTYIELTGVPTGNRAWTFPDSSDTVVGLAATQTLTNKSIAASEVNSGTLAVAQGGTNLASGTSGGILGYTGTGVLASSALLAQNALVVGGGAGATPGTGNGDFTYATHTLTGAAAGLVDLSAITSTSGFKVPVKASDTAAAAGVIDFDSTGKNYHVYANGADAIVAPFASAPTTGDCIQATVSNGNVLLSDSGSASCGGGAALSALTAATGSNTIANGNHGLQIWNWAATTNQNQFQIGETTAATNGTLGSQYIFSAKTLAGSTAVPLGITGSLTGTQTIPTLHITPTWNTSGVVDAGILENVTNTGSGAGSLLADFQVGGTSQWSVDKGGNSVQLGSVTTGSGSTGCGSATGCISMNEASTAGSGSTSLDYIRADSSTGWMLGNFHNSGELPIPILSGSFVAGDCLEAGTTTTEIVDAGSACGSGGGGSSSLSGILAATGSNTIANGNHGAQVWNWAQTTNSQTAFTFGETTAATGTSDQELAVKTIAGSTAIPLVVSDSLGSAQTLAALEVLPTWNTSGVVDAGILENVTNTGSGTASKLIDLQIGGTSEYNVDKAGNSTQLGAGSFGTSPPACTGGTAGGTCFTEGTAFTNASGTAGIYADSTSHELEAKTNGSSSAGLLVRAQPGSVNATTQTGSIGTATLCAASAGACNTAGQYHVSLNIWQSGTACSNVTAGSVAPTITWTDENATAHSAVPFPMITNVSSTALATSFIPTVSVVTAWASGDLTISTNGSVIQYATTYAGCTTGTLTYNVRATVTRLQ